MGLLPSRPLHPPSLPTGLPPCTSCPPTLFLESVFPHCRRDGRPPTRRDRAATLAPPRPTPYGNLDQGDNSQKKRSTAGLYLVPTRFRPDIDLHCHCRRAGRTSLRGREDSGRCCMDRTICRYSDAAYRGCHNASGAVVRR